jgi:hypothetical protein
MKKLEKDFGKFSVAWLGQLSGDAFKVMCYVSKHIHANPTKIIYKDFILEDLEISPKQWRRIQKELVENGYVRLVRYKEKGKYKAKYEFDLTGDLKKNISTTVDLAVDVRKEIKVVSMASDDVAALVDKNLDLILQNTYFNFHEISTKQLAEIKTILWKLIQDYSVADVKGVGLITTDPKYRIDCNIDQFYSLRSSSLHLFPDHLDVIIKSALVWKINTTFIKRKVQTTEEAFDFQKFATDTPRLENYVAFRRTVLQDPSFDVYNAIYKEQNPTEILELLNFGLKYERDYVYTSVADSSDKHSIVDKLHKNQLDYCAVIQDGYLFDTVNLDADRKWLLYIHELVRFLWTGETHNVCPIITSYYANKITA